MGFCLKCGLFRLGLTFCVLILVVVVCEMLWLDQRPHEVVSDPEFSSHIGVVLCTKF